MSHRLPPIAPPTGAQTRVLTRPPLALPGLPWVELAIGLAMLILLRGV